MFDKRSRSKQVCQLLLSLIVGIKHVQGTKRGLRTVDCGLGIEYGLRTTWVKRALIGSR